MKKKTGVVVVPICILLLVSLGLFVFSYKETEKMVDYFEGEEQSSIIALVKNQEEVNSRLEKVSNNQSYTFDNAYLELNPYEISPLSGILIYTSKTKEPVELWINDELKTIFEASTKHVIPLYGLFEDYENKITIKNGTKEKTYSLKTEPSHIKYPLEVSQKIENDDEMIFTVASYETWLTGWDKTGRLRFYLTEDLRMDVEWLSNGHFIIGTTQGQFAENFVGFVEMDYLGKIYHQYTLENGYSFESQVLKNGHILSAGGSSPVYIKEQVIYELDLETGKVVDQINLAEVFKAIDPSFNEKYLGQAAIRNGFYYDEKTNEMIVSFRGIDTVFCVDFRTKEMKWIFTSPSNEVFQNEVWEPYKVKSSGENYPWGQHSPQITSNGLIAFFNNGYERYRGFEVGGEDLVSAYSNHYSRAEAYEIKDKQANLVWSYDANKELFSHQYGSIRIDELNHKFINFGYVLNKDYRSSKTGRLSESEKNPDHIHAEIIELDENDRVIFKATCEEGKYRAFKHALYESKTAYTDIGNLTYFNTIPADELKETTIKTLSLENAIPWINSLKFSQNTFETDKVMNETDDISFYFINKAGKVYVLQYKEKENMQINRIFHLDLTGSYAFYININGEIYKTNRIIKF